MDAVTYPHFAVRAEFDAWVVHSIDAAAHTEVAAAFGVPAVPTAVAVLPDGAVLDRREGFCEPFAFAEWLAGVRAGAVDAP